MLYKKNSTAIIDRVTKYASTRKQQRKEYDLATRSRLYASRKLRYHSDPEYRLKTLIRNRINQAIRHQIGMKCGTTSELLGCDYRELCNYISNQFTEGMNWNKVLLGEIHIDHRLPIASFDMTCALQQKACFHYTNLQPLWAAENNAKRAKVIYDHPFR